MGSIIIVKEKGGLTEQAFASLEAASAEQLAPSFPTVSWRETRIAPSTVLRHQIIGNQEPEQADGSTAQKVSPQISPCQIFASSLVCPVLGH